MEFENLGEGNFLIRGCTADDIAVMEAMGDVEKEVASAVRKHPTPNHYASAHEAKSVIEEELDEYWEHVKANTGYSEDAYKEACQIAATAVRTMLMIRGRQATKL